jgi:hypothetical protein
VFFCFFNIANKKEVNNLFLNLVIGGCTVGRTMDYPFIGLRVPIQQQGEKFEFFLTYAQIELIDMVLREVSELESAMAGPDSVAWRILVKVL